MADLVIKEITLDSGQEVYEATCPFDSTIKPRLPKKEVKANEVETDSDTLASIDEDSIPTLER